MTFYQILSLSRLQSKQETQSSISCKSAHPASTVRLSQQPRYTERLKTLWLVDFLDHLSLLTNKAHFFIHKSYNLIQIKFYFFIIQWLQVIFKLLKWIRWRITHCALFKGLFAGQSRGSKPNGRFKLKPAVLSRRLNIWSNFHPLKILLPSDVIYIPRHFI